MYDWIERERDWEPAARATARRRNLRYWLLVLVVTMVIVLALVASTPAHGQTQDRFSPAKELPDKPVRIIDWSFVAIHGAAGALQARDLYLTSVGVSHHCEEASSNLGPRPGNRRLVAVGLAEFAGVVALDAGMKALARHNKLPRWVGVLGGSLGASVSMFKHVRGASEWTHTNCL